MTKLVIPKETMKILIKKAPQEFLDLIITEGHATQLFDLLDAAYKEGILEGEQISRIENLHHPAGFKSLED